MPFIQLIPFIHSFFFAAIAKKNNPASNAKPPPIPASVGGGGGGEHPEAIHPSNVGNCPVPIGFNVH
jgi:hypothetical protein